MSDAVALVVAELCANAVVHGRVPGRDFELRLGYGPSAGTVRVEVSDTHPERPEAAAGAGSESAASLLAEGGRGLSVAAAVAARWGVGGRVGPGRAGEDGVGGGGAVGPAASRRPRSAVSGDVRPG